MRVFNSFDSLLDSVNQDSFLNLDCVAVANLARSKKDFNCNAYYEAAKAALEHYEQLSSLTAEEKEKRDCFEWMLEYFKRNVPPARFAAELQRKVEEYNLFEDDTFTDIFQYTIDTMAASGVDVPPSGQVSQELNTLSKLGKDVECRVRTKLERDAREKARRDAREYKQLVKRFDN